MLLAVDIGNTNTKFAVFDGDDLISKASIPTPRDQTVDNVYEFLSVNFDETIENAIVCSVVPEVNEIVFGAVAAEFGVDCRVVQNHDDLGIEIRYEPLADAGADRLVNVFSAVEKYGSPLIVCSFGTATTIDAINEERVLLGGVIAPGLRTLSKALHLTTSRLPEVEIEFPDRTIQNTTVECLQSGIVIGYVEMVDGLIRRILGEMSSDARIIVTGGNAALVAEHSAHKMTVEPDLLLDGLAKLAQR
ncbi:MAG TPA: type III pantothenate kinase [Pyrinomonadaceae bacterium]|nr:type III pantothenate kinase [Pyrinomonadaceae bacterium]